MTSRSLLSAMLLVAGCTASAPPLDWAAEELDSPASRVEPSIPEVREGGRTATGRGDESECIEDVSEDAIARLRATLGDVDADDALLQISRIADLDEDGVGDLVVFAEGLCGVSGNCLRSMYLTRDGCLTHAGTFWWAHVEALTSNRGGVSDLELYVKGGCGGLEGTILRLGWSKGGYEVVETIECSCGDEAPEPNPECPGAAL